MSDSDVEFNCTPPQLREIAEGAIDKLVPTKSKDVYEKEYKRFLNWCSKNNAQTVTENVLIAYFEMMGKTKKSSTLWTNYSMIRTMLSIRQNIDISKFMKLLALLKRFSDGYQPKKSKILQPDDIDRFIKEATDYEYLALKVVLIMGYSGACRRDELTNMVTDDIEFKSDVILVSIPKTKTNISRLFAITDELWINLIKKYMNIRPDTATIRRFFLRYHNGRCINQPIGINKMGQMPRAIASFLKLPNPQLYSGHCFRRSSASHLANKGGDLMTIKRHGGWKSSTVAEGYIEASIKKKIEVAQMLSGQPGSSTSDVSGCSRILNTNIAPNNVKQTPQNIPGIVITDAAHTLSGQPGPSTSDVAGCSRTLNTNIALNNVQQTLQSIPGIVVHAAENCSVSINVYNSCTIARHD